MKITQEKNTVTQEIQSLAQKIQTLEKEKSLSSKKAQKSSRRAKAVSWPLQFWARQHCRDLSQLISMYLMRKPRGIDREVIFERVKDCYDEQQSYDWKQYCDMRMLLFTCRASNWFTEDQWNDIDRIISYCQYLGREDYTWEES